MEKHITQFTIHAYKGINDLTLPELNCINILTGDNNSGKTSVLELLSTIEAPQNISSWILCSRAQTSRVRRGIYFNGFCNMFPIDSDNSVISYSFTDKNNATQTVILTADMEELQMPEQEMHQVNGLRSVEPVEKEENLTDVICMHLKTFINDTKVNEDAIYDFQYRLPKSSRKSTYFTKTVYVSPVDHANGSLNINQLLSDSELYEKSIEIFRAFDENITSINAIEKDDFPFSTEYMVLTKNHRKALPLNAYGDGIKKAMLLLNSVVYAENGILLLDEFETAIHTSAMNSVFSRLLKSALDLNTQVFLTSHSKEAIDTLLQCDESLQPYINLYTLYKADNKNYVRTMSAKEALHAQKNLGLELR